MLDFEAAESYGLSVQVSDGKGGLDTGIVTIDVIDVADEILSVDDRREDVVLSVYPNPASDQLTINLQQVPAGDYTIQLISVLGTRHELYRGYLSGDREATIDVSRFPKGVYVVQVLGKTGKTQVLSVLD
jgi:hypothetical protein